MDWLRDWWETAKAVIRSPQAFFQGAEPGEAGESLRFAAISYLVYGAIIGGFMAVAGGGSALVGAGLSNLSAVVFLPVYLIVAPIAGVVGTLVGAAVIHLVVHLLGGQGFDRTLSAVAYATVVQALLGWIPIVNVFAALYVLYVQIRGIEAFHGFSTGRAALAVLLLPLLIVIIAFLGMAASFAAVPAAPVQ